MKYDVKELSYILYNNRSSELTKRFINKDVLNVLGFIERGIDAARTKYNKIQQVGIDISNFDFETEDILFDKSELESYTDIVDYFRGMFNNVEWKYLKSRNISEQIIHNNGLFGMSCLKSLDKRAYDVLGISTHPSMKRFLGEDFTDGICMPLFNEEGNLENVTTRKIHDAGKLKFTQAVPSVSVYGKILEPSMPIYTVEGLFDMYALQSLGLNAFSCSTAIWSPIQLNNFVTKKIKGYEKNEHFIWSDNDQTGIRSALILKEILKKPFKVRNIHISIKHSTLHKDPCEHVMEFCIDPCFGVKTLDTDEEHFISTFVHTPFNITSSLKNRKF